MDITLIYGTVGGILALICVAAFLYSRADTPEAKKLKKEHPNILLAAGAIGAAGILLIAGGVWTGQLEDIQAPDIDKAKVYMETVSPTGTVRDVMSGAVNASTAIVEFYPAGTTAEQMKTESPLYSDTVDSSGVWVISGIPAGTYAIRSTCTGYYYTFMGDRQVRIDRETYLETASYSVTLTGLDIVEVGTIDKSKTATSAAVTNGTAFDLNVYFWNSEADSILKDCILGFADSGSVTTFNDVEVAGSGVSIHSATENADFAYKHVHIGDIDENQVVVITVSMTISNDSNDSITFYYEDMDGETANIEDATSATSSFDGT